MYNYNDIKWWMNRIKTRLFYKHLFGAIGPCSTICKPMRLCGLKNVCVGRHFRMREFGRMETISEYEGKVFNPKIVIGDDVGIEQGLHMVCADSIIIGDKTTMSAYVTVMDCTHSYNSINENVLNQELITKPVVIGESCFIGIGGVLLPGTHLGNHCTVGSNAVVTGIWPDYCILVGAPAKCIKRYDVESQCWRKTNKSGMFLS